MKNAAIYCRVSTEDQEREGTSLQTQFEACQKYCQGKSYEIAYRFSEAYSGLTLERPKLDELRELIRNEQIEVVVVYCLDRLSRDPVHGVIIIEELEKHGVKLEAVTETVDASEVGKLISYIRGFASKLEAQKIRERTMRGRKAKAQQGQLVGGGSAKIYGYDYIKVSNKNGGRRAINEAEAKWVRQIFNWLVNDGMSTRAITLSLRKLNAPTKCGGIWGRSSVIQILKNPAYTGKTYLFTTVNGKQFRKPQHDWIEIPDVTPAFISQEMFETAQKQLQINRERSSRNSKREYLLRGHIRCRQCGKAYAGGTTVTKIDNKQYESRHYHCTGKWSSYPGDNRCSNKSWRADKVETLVWEQIEHVLDNPELIISEIEKQRQDVNQLGILEVELQHVERQLKALDREQKELLDNALRGFPESLIIAENKKINTKRTALESQKSELEAQIKTSNEATICLPKLEKFVELMRQKLSMLDYETKRMALDMLGIKVWLDGNDVEITGVVPVSDDVIVTTQS